MADSFEKRRRTANLGFMVGTALLVLITRHVESAITFVLPILAVRWMISRESRIAQQRPSIPRVPRATSIRLFAILPAISACLIVFWAPNYMKGFNLWGLYGICSFSLALLLVKLYERFLLIRRRLAPEAAAGVGVE